jgi:membrane protease subunit HflK
MSLNDPQWGKRNRTGPPDLEEIWRNVNRRLNTIFGRKEPEGGDGGPPPTKSSFPIGGAGMLGALVVVIWLASGFYIVDEGRRGVVTRFGKYTETTTPGPRWHLPFPIEAVEVVDFSQVKTVEIGYRNGNPRNKIAKESLFLTDDENIIDIQFAVQYNLKRPPTIRSTRANPMMSSHRSRRRR